ncbi:hypothetical protein Tco_0135112 [Tanacetum coccineum]
MGRDTIRLEDAVLTISGEYPLEFTSKYGIPESLHPELPSPKETIVDFPKGKVGVYTKFFEFANYHIPLTQFLFDILGYYQIYMSQLSVIGAAKVSNFEINCRVQNIIPTLNLFRVFYVLSFNSGWMSFSKRPGKNTPQCYTKPLNSLKNWNNRFFWVDERIFPTVVDWRTSAPKDGMPLAGSYSAADVAALDTHRTPFQKLPETLLCLVGLSRNYYLGDDVYPTFLHDDDREMDLFSLIRNPNPAKVKIGTRTRAAHEVPLLTATASRVIDMEDTTMASGSSGTSSTIEKSPLDFENENHTPSMTEGVWVEDQAQDGLAHEDPPMEIPITMGVVQEPGLKEVVAIGSPVNQRRRKRGTNEAEANAQPKVLRNDYTSIHPAQSTHGGKYLAAIGLEAGSTFTPVTQETSAGAKSVSDPESLSYAKPLPHPKQDVAQSSKGTATEIPTKYVATTKKLDEEIKPLRTVETEVHGLRNQTQNLETLLEAKVDMKKAAKAKNVSNLQAQVAGEERIKAAFKEFKKCKDDKVERRCAEIDARLDALSIDFDEELYPHMLTAIAGRRWVVGHSLRLAVMKYAESTELREVFADVVSAGITKGMSEGLKHGLEHEKAKLDLTAIEAYDPEAETKYVAALHALKDFKYPLIDQLEKLRDAPIDLIMASLYLESDSGEDAP